MIEVQREPQSLISKGKEMVLPRQTGYQQRDFHEVCSWNQQLLFLLSLWIWLWISFWSLSSLLVFCQLFHLPLQGGIVFLSGVLELLFLIKFIHSAELVFKLYAESISYLGKQRPK